MGGRMARGKKTQNDGIETADYRHSGEKRKNIPPAKIAGEGKVPKISRVRYRYNPHLPPVLRFDVSGAPDKLPELVAQAGKRQLKLEEQKLMADALRRQEPWLEWAGKKEQHDKRFFDVDPVALHIHERVSAQACVRAAMREDTQRELFADPQQSYKEAVQFYRHDVDWANRLILGDSLQVMSSLCKREGLAGKVQMIYVDPPYGIKFASNFQAELGKRDVKDRELDLTREPEMVKAYRDTWQLGIHSYLSYLRDRLLIAKDLLHESGSLFVQISDDNFHRVKCLLDEVFDPRNFCSVISFTKTTGLHTTLLASRCDYLLWYAKDITKVKFRQLFLKKAEGEEGASQYDWVYTKLGEKRRKGSEGDIDADGRLFHIGDASAMFTTPHLALGFDFDGKIVMPPSNRQWQTTQEGMRRLARADRLLLVGNSLRYVRFLEDFPVVPLNALWTDTGLSGFAESKRYVVQTNTKVITRCMLMTSDPGELVVDPTCGSGTTAVVAEQWGRRWITIDTSRVALSIARQRVLTAKYEHYQLQQEARGPAGGFSYKTAPHVTLKSIAQNANLDPILDKYEPIMEEKLTACNNALAKVGQEVRQRLSEKLLQKQKQRGKRAVTDADLRRWGLPKRFEHWTVPFDADPDWPKGLHDAVLGYRAAWRTKMNEVDACIAANAEQEELVDEPEVVRGILRVSGPYTVEGVTPEELSLGEDGLFDGTPDSYGPEEDDPCFVEPRNIRAYLTRMVQSLQSDGVTFLNNKKKMFARLEPQFEDGTGSLVHAEGIWDGCDTTGPCSVAVSFGPQYGPVTALQVEEVIRSSKRYDELVIAGFSFDPEAGAVIQESTHPRLRIHQAYIRPDINPGMDGLLKETPNSQLFTVFGQPEVAVTSSKDGKWVCKLKGVDIYDPLTNTIRSTGADKVAAWFLDSDYDGRCFCITQAFFPDQDAWEKIAKALKASADADAFEKFKGTESLPFAKGKYRRIAVKVIDPRGNEVMAIRNLKD